MKTYLIYLIALAAFCISSCVTVPPFVLNPGPTAPEPSVPPSAITVQIKTSFPALAGALDNEVPKCAGSFPGCQGTEESGNFIIQREGAWEMIGSSGFGWKASVWRWTPVGLDISGGRVTASLSALYHVKIANTHLQDVSVGCGYGEQARGMAVSLSGIVDPQPGWFLDPRLSITLRPLTPCTVILDSYDAAPLLAKAIQDRLQKSVDKISDDIRIRTNIHDKAVEVWKRIGQPFDLGNNVWFTLNPDAVSYSGLDVEDGGQSLAETVSLEAQPLITVGQQPVSTETPLPDLQQKAMQNNFELYLKGLLDYKGIAADIANILGKKDYPIGGDKWPVNLFSFHMTDVNVYPDSNKIVIALKIDGHAKGTLYLWGIPKFIPSNEGVGGKVVLDQVDFYPDTRNALVQLGNIIFHNKLEDSIRTKASWDVTPEMSNAYNALNKEINRNLADGMSLSGSISSFGQDASIWVAKTAIEPLFPIKGTVTLTVSTP